MQRLASWKITVSVAEYVSWQWQREPFRGARPAVRYRFWNTNTVAETNDGID